MGDIRTFDQADAHVKKLIPIQDNIEATVAAEPQIYDSKMFWPVIYVDVNTKQPITLFGSISYIADNGKLITFSSNPMITPFEDHEKLLVAEY